MKLCSIVLFACSLIAETAAGIKWTAPAGWKPQAEKPMRAATYAVGDAECAVYFFGEGQGGSIDANLERWKGQFQGASGVKSGKKIIHGIAVTTTEVSGAYTGMGGPMGGGGAAKPGYRMLAAIAEGPGGNVFFKFTGPSATIAANQAKFDLMIGSLTK